LANVRIDNDIGQPQTLQIGKLHLLNQRGYGGQHGLRR
jgi:hypothetical protein